MILTETLDYNDIIDEDKEIPGKKANRFIEWFTYSMKLSTAKARYLTTAGLFPESKWYELFETAGFRMGQKTMNSLHDAFILGEEDYPMVVFIGVKK